MTFWQEASWQHCTADAIAGALDDVHASLYGRNLGGKDWTGAVMESIAALTPAVEEEECDCACAHMGAGAGARGWYTGGEWVFDLAWIVQARNPRSGEAALTRGLPLVLECEWHGWKSIWDDFDKLALSRSGLRVMIFDGRDAPHDWRSVLLDRVDAYAESSPRDAWLLCSWTDRGFCHTRRIGGVVT